MALQVISTHRVLPLHADGHQGEWAAVDGGGLHEGDDVADDLTKWKVAKGEQNSLPKEQI